MIQSPKSKILNPQEVGVDPELAEMRVLARRVGQRCVLQPSVLAQLGHEDLPASTLHALTTLIEGPFRTRRRERRLAVWALGRARIEPGRRSAVAATLRDVLIGDRAQGDVPEVIDGTVRRTKPFALAFALLAAANAFIHPEQPFSLLLYRLVWCAAVGAVAFVIATFSLFPVVLPLSWVTDAAYKLRLRAAAATALGRLRYPECLGVLADAAMENSATLREEAETALRATAAVLTAAHYGQLASDPVPSLCRLLNARRRQLYAGHTRTEELVICLLEALAILGDSRALPVVQSIATDGWTEAACQAARRTLPVLLERKQQETDRSSLLRGSRLPDTEPATLLRPATAETVAPESLLRPVNSGQRP